MWVVAVSDVCGVIYCGAGIDVTVLWWVVTDGLHSVTGYQYGVCIDNVELFELDVDVFVFVALEGVIIDANVDAVGVCLIVEGANGPTILGADHVFADRGIVVVSDILANAGGVVVFYLEWVQNF